jgi:hypothetical protein
VAGLPAAPRIFASASIDQSVGPPLPSQIFVERVLAIINAHDPSTPLFLFWAPHIVHAPLEVPQAYLDKFAVHPSAQGDKLGEVLWRVSSVSGVVSIHR